MNYELSQVPGADMTIKTQQLPIDSLLSEAEMEVGRFDWEGTFADYLRMVSDLPSITRLSHKLIYDAIITQGVEESESTGEPAYTLFKEKIYGLDDEIERVMQYFASSSRRLASWTSVPKATFSPW